MILPAVTAQHQGDGGPAGIEAGVQVHCQDFVPLGRSHVREQTEMGHSGIVHQHIDLPDPREELRHILFAPHVRPDSPAGDSADGLQPMGQLLQLPDGMSAGEDQVEAVFREKRCSGPAYAPGRAGDQGGLSFLYHAHVSLLRFFPY